MIISRTTSCVEIAADKIESAAAADALVRFVAVEKSYDGRTHVVRKLDLSVRRGEFLTLLGPSGSGKTTCLMMLAGFEPWTAGDILLNGKSLRDVPAHDRGIGVVFQNYALFPHMSVAQNVGYALRQRKCSRDETSARVRRALDMVELPTLGDRYPAQLSGGQQQRVALARALVFEPELVLMDEPLGALDRRLREQMQAEIRRLHHAIGNTVVYVTHDQDEALTMSDRIAVFNRGSIEQIASPQDLYERPATRFVANFVGDNNAIPATVRESDSRECVVCTTADVVLRGVPVRPFAPGERVEVAIRPELVRLDAADTGDDNTLNATIIEVTYFGEHTALRCQSGELIVSVKIGLETFRAQALVAGAIVTLSWRSGDCRILAST